MPADSDTVVEPPLSGSYFIDACPHRMRSGSPGSILPAVENRGQNGLKTAQSATSDVRGLLARSRLPPIRGGTSSVSRHGPRGVGCFKQLPKPVFQQFDGLPQGAELPNPDYRDGPVQVKQWGTQYFHGIDRMIPGNKASRQQPDTITGLNERQLHMHVVDFSRKQRRVHPRAAD